MTAADPVLEQAVDFEQEHAPAVDRIAWIEGLRGVAALVVALGHIVRVDHGIFAATWQESGWPGRIFWPLNYNGMMVPLFLVISAFSLVYAEDTRRLRGRRPTDFPRFLRRRAWRLTPVYLVALALGLVVTLSISARALAQTAEALRPTVSGTLAHLVFAHNASSRWEIEGNAPLWSLAYEAQLYLLLPLLAFFIKGRRGTALTLITCAALIAAQSHVPYRLDLVTYFVVGVWLARTYRVWPERLHLPTAAAFWALLLIAVYRTPANSRIATLLWALVFGSLILTVSGPGRGGSLSIKPLRILGSRSYSLYAMHIPVVILLAVAAHALGLSGPVAAAAVFAVAVPLVAAVVECTFRWVEVPSLARVRRT